MNQPQKQGHGHANQEAAPPKWEPDDKTTFLIVDDVEFDKRARLYLRRKYPRSRARILTAVNVKRLTAESVIVALYFDADRDITGEDGNPKQREPRHKDPHTNRVVKQDLPDVLESAQIKCTDLYVPGGEDDDGAVQVRNTVREDGVVRKGVISRIVDATMDTDQFGRKRCFITADYRDDIGMLKLKNG